MFLQEYFQTLLRSASSVRYYLEIPRKPLSFSLLFFVISCVLIGSISSVKFLSVELPTLRQQWQETINQLEDSYPSDLVFSWDGTVLTLIPAEPRIIPYPETVSVNSEVFPPIFMYFANREIEIGNLNTVLPAETLLVVTPTRLLANESTEGWNELPLSSLPGFDHPFILDSASLPLFVQSWQNVANTLFQVASIGSFIFFPLITLISLLWTSLLDSLLFYFLLQFNGFRLRLKKVWQISLHIVVIAGLVTAVAKLIYPNMTFPLLTAASWGLFTYIFIVLRIQLSQSLQVKTKDE